MNDPYAEVEAPKQRATENRLNLRPDQSPSKTGDSATSAGSGDISRGTPRTSRVGRTLIERLVGGILAQLIEQVADRLGEAEECVIWYQRQTETLTQKLQELRELQALLEIEAEPSEDE